MYRMIIAGKNQTELSRLANFFPWSTIGIEVFGTTMSGSRLEELVDENRIDIVLCDVEFSHFDSLKFAKKIYDSGRRTMVVLMSETETVELYRLALKYRVRGVLLKSEHMELDELLTAFRQVVRELDKYEDHVNMVASTADRATIIFEYIYSNGRVATLQSTAEHFGMNPQYFSRYVKRLTGKNFSEILLEARMLQARNLFDCMDIHVSEVSRKVGYKSPQNFSRAFKKVFGMTPYQYKCSHVSMEYITSQIAHKPGDN